MSLHFIFISYCFTWMSMLNSLVSIKNFSIMKWRLYKTLVHLESEPLYKAYLPYSWVLFLSTPRVLLCNGVLCMSAEIQTLKKIRGTFLYFYFTGLSKFHWWTKENGFQYVIAIFQQRRRTVRSCVGIGPRDLVRVRESMVIRNFRCQWINMAQVYFSIVSLMWVGPLSWVTVPKQ